MNFISLPGTESIDLMGLTGRTKDSDPPNLNSRDELIITLSGADSMTLWD